MFLPLRVLLAALLSILLASCNRTPALPAEPFELHRIFDHEEPDRIAVSLPDDTRVRYMEKAILLDATALKNAQAVPAANGWQIIVTLTEAGGKAFTTITAANIGSQIAIVCGTDVLAAPRILDRIAGDTLVISGTFDQAKAEAIAARLKAAAKKR